MPTFTIDLPDNLNIRDARTFVLEKLYETGFFASDQTLDESAGEDDDSDSWLTPEMREQIAENRKRLEKEFAENPPKMSHEEFSRFLLNFPVADEETIKRQDEVREHMRQWKMSW